MNKIISYLKVKKIIILATVSLLATVFIVIQINRNKKEKINNVPAPKTNIQVASYKEIMTGDQFNEDKINNLLGFPTESTSSGEIKINKYRSSNEYRTNELMIKNGVVDFIREVVNPKDNKNANDIRNTYGVADAILYERSSNSYFNLYVYFKNGIAYLGHDDGGVLEIWYFKPTGIDSFIQNYAPNYQKTPFTGQAGH